MTDRVSAHVMNKSRLVVKVPPGIPDHLLKQWGEDLAEIVEDRIARDFERERAAGKALKGVSSDHVQAKARDGLDLRKGHMYGDLQDALDNGGFAKVQAKRGRIDITWNENDLISRVPHAEYYAEAKVPGQRILIVLAKDATQARQYVNARVRDHAAAGS